jgi:glutamate-5-semialdehyde dehydrogenase
MTSLSVSGHNNNPDDAQALQVVSQAQTARYTQRQLTGPQRTAALLAMAQALAVHQPAIMAANQQDLADPDVTNLPLATQNRLQLTPAKWQPVLDGLHQLAHMPDPVGQVLRQTLLDDGLTLQQQTLPLGVLLIIFEARPDVLPQVAGLALKSGNVLIAKGGTETTHTNRAILHCLQQALAPYCHPQWVQCVEGRAMVQALLAHHQGIDLVIPRGSNAMVQHIMAHTRIPVLGHADGVCHLYWHASAPLADSLAVVLDAKTQYPAACNALETLLIDATCAPVVLPQLAQAAAQAGITLTGCPQTQALLPQVALVTEWHQEYGDLTLAIKCVDTVQQAMAHIQAYGSHHTDGILAEDADTINAFLAGVDSASVFVNTSTRFADGFRYGLGAEVGISTSRTHARGPVGLQGLLTTRWVLTGQYQTVKPYACGAKSFLHKPLG